MLDPAWYQHTLLTLVKGFGLTVYIGLIAIALALVLGLVLALMRISSNRPLAGFAFLYSTCFRGSPLLVQLFIIYYGIGTLPFMRHSPALWWLFGDGRSEEHTSELQSLLRI